MSEDIPGQCGGFASTKTHWEYTFGRGTTFPSRIQNSRITVAATFAPGQELGGRSTEDYWNPTILTGPKAFAG